MSIYVGDLTIHDVVSVESFISEPKENGLGKLYRYNKLSIKTADGLNFEITLFAKDIETSNLYPMVELERPE